MLRWTKGAGVDMSGFHNLEAFERRMRADKDVQKVLKHEGVDQK
jgi:hypothetical protein